MGLSSTFNGVRVTEAHVTIPAWGCWYAEVSIDGEQTLTGSATLQLADLTLKGTILSGGPTLGRSTFRIVGGAGGWGKSLDKQNYTNDFGVKLSKVLGDAASAVGETLVVGSDSSVGPAWTRQEGPASSQLNVLAPKAWYVDELGVTRLGARAKTALTTTATRVQKADLARGTVVLATETIAALLPGVTVDGIAAVDVKHELTPGTGLRTTLYGAQHASTLDSMRALLAQLDPNREYRGVKEYRVVTLSGDLMNLQPVRVSTGMPDLARVAIWPGLAGCKTKPPLGSRCLVGFIDSDPARPYVSGFEAGAAATALELTTDGLGAGGHAITAEQVIGLFAQYTAARSLVGDLGATFSATYLAAPPATLALLMASMVAGATLPATPVGATPGSVLDALGLPALIQAAIAAQLLVPDPASIGLPTPVIPGLCKANLKL